MHRSFRRFPASWYRFIPREATACRARLRVGRTTPFSCGISKSWTLFFAVITLTCLSGCAIKSELWTFQELETAQNIDPNPLFVGQAPITHPINLYEAIARSIKYNLDHRVQLFENVLSRANPQSANHDFLPKMAALAGFTHRQPVDLIKPSSPATHASTTPLAPSPESPNKTPDPSAIPNATTTPGEPPLPDPNETKDSSAAPNSNSAQGEPSPPNPDKVQEQTHAPNPNQDRDTRPVDLNLVWNVLDFGISYYQSKQNINPLLLTPENRRKLVHIQLQEVQLAFWHAASAQQLQNKIQSLIDDAKQAIEEAYLVDKARIKPQLEVMRFQQLMADHIQKLEKLQAELELNKKNMARMLNLAPTTPFVLDIPPEKNTRLQTTLSEMEHLALLNRPELYMRKVNAQFSVDKTHQALLTIQPGLEFQVWPQFDMALTLNSVWESIGLQVTSSLVDVASEPADMPSEEIPQEDHPQQQTLSMAVLAQVQIAYRHYLDSLKKFEAAKATSRQDAAKIASMPTTYTIQGKLARIQTASKAVVSQLYLNQAYAEVQNAISLVLVSYGVAALPTARHSEDLATLTQAFRKSVKFWTEDLPNDTPPLTVTRQKDGEPIQKSNKQHVAMAIPSDVQEKSLSKPDNVVAILDHSAEKDSINNKNTAKDSQNTSTVSGAKAATWPKNLAQVAADTKTPEIKNTAPADSQMIGKAGTNPISADVPVPVSKATPATWAKAGDAGATQASIENAEKNNADASSQIQVPTKPVTSTLATANTKNSTQANIQVPEKNTTDLSAKAQVQAKAATVTTPDKKGPVNATKIRANVQEKTKTAKPTQATAAADVATDNAEANPQTPEDAAESTAPDPADTEKTTKSAAPTPANAEKAPSTGKVAKNDTLVPTGTEKAQTTEKNAAVNPEVSNQYAEYDKLLNAEIAKGVPVPALDAKTLDATMAPGIPAAAIDKKKNADIAKTAPERQQEIVEKQIRILVQNWVESWKKHAIQKFLEFYSKSFRPSGSWTRRQWEQAYTNLFGASTSTQVTLAKLTVEVETNQLARAYVLLDLRSNDTQRQIEKMLIIKDSDGGWHIEEETAMNHRVVVGSR